MIRHILLLVTLKSIACLDSFNLPQACIEDPGFEDNLKKKVKATDSIPENNRRSEICDFKDTHSDSLTGIVKKIDAKDKELSLVISEAWNINSLMSNFYFNPTIGKEFCYYNQDTLYLVLEKFKNNLWEFTNDEHNEFRNSMVWRMYIALTLTRYLVRLHENRFVHLDFKLENVLVRNGVEIVFADFESFKAYGKMENIIDGMVELKYSFVCTTLFAAPEIHCNYKHENVKGAPCYGPASDFYSLGVSLFLLLTGELDQNILEGQTATKTIEEYNKNNSFDTLQIYDLYFKQNIIKMVDPDYGKRPNGQEIIKLMEESIINALVAINEKENLTDESFDLQNENTNSSLLSFLDYFTKTLYEREISSKSTPKPLSKTQKNTLIKDAKIFFKALPKSARDGLYSQMYTRVNKIGEYNKQADDIGQTSEPRKTRYSVCKQFTESFKQFFSII